MAILSTKSLTILAECHQDLQILVKRAIRYIDFSVDEAHRGKDVQEAHFAAGRSKVHFPNSKHNLWPAEAVHLLPYPEKWQADQRRWYYLGGIIVTLGDILYEAGETGHRIRWGGDWDSDDTFADQTFHDLAHFELDSGIGTG